MGNNITIGNTGIPALDARPLWDGGRDFSLETPRKLLAELGSPQNNCPSIHVGGTNGKGSVCSFIASILYQSGASVGQFTSPHLSHVNERCLINGEAVAFNDLTVSVNKVISAADSCGVDPSFFELISAASYLEFQRRALDYMVIEVGLGGRLDATNLMNKVAITVVTNVQYDHMHILGNTLEKIAREKSGIIREKTPLVLGKMDKEALKVFRQRASELSVPLMVYGEDFCLSDSGHTVEFKNSKAISIPNVLPLPGKHQRENAAVAVCAARFLNIAPKDIFEGLKQTRWPGRLEWVEQENTPPVLLDVGHNVDGIKSILGYLNQYLKETKVCNIEVVCSILERKNWQEMLGILKEGFDRFESCFGIKTHFIFTASSHKSAVASELLLSHIGCGEAVPNPEQALAHASQRAGSRGFVVVLGSAYLVGELRPLIVKEPFRTIVPKRVA